MIDTTPLWPLRTSCDGGLEQRPLVGPADERDVAAHRSRPGGVRPGDQPRLLDLLAAASWVTPNGSRGIAGEHSAMVAAPTSTPPGGASACSRDAVLTTSPIAV